MGRTAERLYHLGDIPVPLGDGQIPLLTPRRDDSSGTTTQEYGKIYWVGKGGDDSNDGESWEARKLTVASAVTAANGDIDTAWSVSPWGPSATIIVAPGVYAENLTALPYGCNLIGLGDAFDINGERGVIIKPATGSPVDVTSCINSRIQNICFAGTDTSVLFQADNFNRVIMQSCVFAGVPGTSPTTTHGLQVIKDFTGSIVRGCVFWMCKFGIHINTDNANDKQLSGSIFEDLHIMGSSTAGIHIDSNCNPTLTSINRCVIGDGSVAMALGLDDDTGQVLCSNTVFQATACDPASGDGDSKYNACYLNGTLMT